MLAPGTMLLTGTGRLAPAGTSPWAIHVRDGRIAWIGRPAEAPSGVERLDLGSALVTPGLVDSHTHPLFAGDRSDEAAARLDGAPYSGGGILRTVAATRAADDATLEALCEARLRAALAAGTTTVECKSGYGLSLDEELRHLRIIRRVAERLPMRVVTTFLGAHAVPDGSTAADHAARVADEMIPAVAAEGLAQFVDVFADTGFFGLTAAERVGRAAASAGLGLRLHAEQLERTGAAELGVRLGAASVDHLEQLDEAGVAALAASATVATLLPAPAIVLRDRLPPARALLDAGATVALASDANAGTYGGFGTMPLVIGLGATLLGMTAGEALTAATAGAAQALRRPDLGRLEIGAAADLAAWDAEHEGAFALRLGATRPRRVWISGAEIGL
jgi:imidazolonepropionase